MELSGLIFVALAVIWAAVLIPKALQHHDELARTRSVEDVSRERRVVRRGSAGDPPDAAPPAPRDERAELRASAAAAARRRRRVLGLLMVAAAGVAVAAALGALPLWTVAVPVVLTVAFLVLARVLVRREHARWARHCAAEGAAGRAAVVEPASRRTTAAGGVPAPPADAEPPAEPDVVLPMVSGLDDTTSVPVGLIREQQAGGLWEPLPVTLPTYVGKPRATRSVRTISLDDPGVASSGRDAAASALVAEAAAAPAPQSAASSRTAVGS